MADNPCQESKPIIAKKSRPPSARAPRGARKLAQGDTAPDGFIRALEVVNAAGSYALESPRSRSRGSPRKAYSAPNFDPPTLARLICGRVCAACLSVLTDTPSFQGKPYYRQLTASSAPRPSCRAAQGFHVRQLISSGGCAGLGADCI